MLKHLLSSTAIVAVLAATPALAADQKKMDQKAAQTQSMNSPSFVTTQGESDWLGSALIGRSVVNNQNETIGDINNIVVNEQGDLDAVVIGVGGFLGIGEKDVGVKFSSLEFRKDETQAAAREQAGKPMNPAMNPKAADKMRSSDTAATDKGDTSQMTADERRQAMMKDKGNARMTDRETGGRNHSDMVIVLNMSKEQLESAPAYAYLDEKQDRTNPDTASDKPKKQ